jgi:hypothetical protein
MKPLKILSRIGLVLLIVVAAVLAVRAVLNYTEGRALTRALAALKAEGVPLTAKELAPPCPDEDNGARLWKAYENIAPIPRRQLQPGVANRPAAKNPVSGLIARAWGDFHEGKPVAPADRAALKEVIRANAKSLGLVAEMADKPCFLYRDPAQPVMDALPPDAIQMIQTTELLFFSALFSAEDGDMSGAVSNIVSGLKFADLTAQEGTLMACLVSLAETRVLTHFLGDICRGRDLSDPDLKRLMDAQDSGAWRGRLAAGFRGERVMYVEAWEFFTTGGLRNLGSMFEWKNWWDNLGLWTIRPLVKKDIRQSLPVFDFLEAEAKIPYDQSRDVLRARYEELRKRPWYAVASKTLIGNFEGAYLKVAQVEALMLASRAGLACRLYKSRTGRYPERLEELVPGLLPEVPIDPFTGKPLVYRREGEGFIVYSLGSNQKDDGGRSTYMITQLVMDKDDDWSWKEDK